MDLSKYIITSQDIHFIIDNNVINSIFYMYQLDHLNKNGERNNLINYNLLEICKAFFIPPSAIKYKPQDTSHLQGIENTKYNDTNQFYTTSSKEYIDAIKRELKKIEGFTLENFYEILYSKGYGRKLDILLKYFKLDNQVILSLLYTIFYVNHETVTTQSKK